VSLVRTDVSEERVASIFWIDKNPLVMKSVSSGLTDLFYPEDRDNTLLRNFVSIFWIDKNPRVMKSVSSGLTDLFYPEGGDDMLLRNFCSYKIHITTFQKMAFLVTAVKTSSHA
jgi:hypothetical protein